MPSSSAVPRASRNVLKVATRAAGISPSSLRPISGTPGPDRRTTPIPPRPAGVATAAMVSRVSSSLGMGRTVAIEHALDLPLLGDGEDVVHQPVQHQAGGEEEEKDAENER